MEEIDLIMMSALVIVIIILLLLVKRKNNTNEKYDERQILVIGNSFKYGFLVTIIYYALYSELAQIFQFYNAPLIFLGILIGLVVASIYQIVNDAYFGLEKNRNKKAFLVLILMIGIFDFATGILSIVEEGVIVENSLNVNFIYVETGVVLVITSIAKLIKDSINKKEQVENEES